MTLGVVFASNVKLGLMLVMKKVRLWSAPLDVIFEIGAYLTQNYSVHVQHCALLHT